MKIIKYFILVIPILIIIGLPTAIYLHYKSSKEKSVVDRTKHVQPFKDIKDLESLMKRLPLANKPAPSSDKEKKGDDDITPELRAKIDALKKRLEERLAKIKARSPYRKVLRGQAENGNAWGYYTKAFEILKNADFDELLKIPEIEGTYENPTEEQKKEAAKVVKKYKDALELLKKGTRQEMCDREDNWEDIISFSYLDYTSPAIQLSRFASRGVYVMAEDGKPDEAMELALDLMRFGQDTSKNGTLIHHLVGIVEEVMGKSAIVDILSDYNIDTQKLNAYIDEVNILQETQPSVFDAIEVDALPGSYSVANTLAIYSNSEFRKLQEKIPVLWGYRPPIVDKSEAVEGLELLLPFTDTIISLKGKPYKEISDVMTLEVKRLTEKNKFIAMYMSGGNNAMRAYFSSTPRYELLKTAMAVKIYQQEKGVYPKQLEEIGYIIPIPIDIFTGEPLKYRVSEDGNSVTIYSVGPNLKDDGGSNKDEGEDDVSLTLQIKKK